MLPRLIFASVLVALVGVFCYWQAPGTKLTPADLSALLERKDAGLPMEPAEKAEFIARLRAYAPTRLGGGR